MFRNDSSSEGLAVDTSNELPGNNSSNKLSPNSASPIFNSSANTNDDQCSFTSNGSEEGVINKIAFQLHHFFLESCLSIKMQQNLLDILANNQIIAPRTVYQLRRDTQTKNTLILPDNNYYYGSLKESLEYCFSNFISSGIDDLHLHFGVDGMPPFRSSKISLWPILLRINASKKIIVVGMYCGVEKPNLEKLVGPLVRELNSFKEGVSINGRMKYIASISFIADTPARAFLQCVKSHNAYEACAYCRIEGKWIEGRMIYPFYKADSRCPELYRLGEKRINFPYPPYQVSVKLGQMSPQITCTPFVSVYVSVL